MPPSLLASQLSTLQAPDDIVFTSRKTEQCSAIQNDGINLMESSWGLIKSSHDIPMQFVTTETAGTRVDEGSKDSVLLRITVGEGDDYCEFPDVQQCVNLIMEALARRERGE